MTPPFRCAAMGADQVRRRVRRAAALPFQHLPSCNHPIAIHARTHARTDHPLTNSASID